MSYVQQMDGQSYLNTGPRTGSTADTALKLSAGFWFVIAVLGQWMFAYYVMMFYGGSALEGNAQVWTEVLSYGIISGDPMGNIAISAHLLFAFIITVGGPLQLIPQIRSIAPTFHRWNGRVYLITALIISVSGLYVLWSRGTVGDTSQHIGTSLNAVLVISFAIMAWRHAVARNIRIHRRWALRLFIAASGVWFFRIGLMFWFFIHRGPVGLDPETFTGPFLSFLAFADYLLPLAILEIYLRIKDSNSSTGKFILSGSLFLLAIATATGIMMATMGMWLPRI